MHGHTLSEVRRERGRDNVAAEVVKRRTEIAVSKPSLYLLTFALVTFAFQIHHYLQLHGSKTREKDVYILPDLHLVLKIYRVLIHYFTIIYND